MKVSICIITYNHEKFIAQALDSVLMQRVNFDYDVVIGEDCSTDSTRDIVIDYKKKYPAIIRLLLPDKNLGMFKNYLHTLSACKGEYTAFVEGDDYWTSPYKLQKQADFLDSHPDFSMCFHPVEVICEDNFKWPQKLFGDRLKKSTFGVADLFKYGNFIPTGSIVRRREIADSIPEWFLKLDYGDWAQNIFSARVGKIGIIDEVMGAYRVHAGGVWTRLSRLNQLKMLVENYKLVGKHLGLKKKLYYRQGIGRQLFLLAREYENAGDPTLAKAASLEGFLNYPIAKHNLKRLIRLSFPGVYNSVGLIRNKTLAVFRK